MSSTKPLVYLILGAAGSGRREVLADLIEGGFDAEDQPAVMFAEGEMSSDADARLPGLSLWTWENDAIDGTLPAGAKNIFFVTHGRHNPVDQIEAFQSWLQAQGGELARVLCIIDCQLAEKNPPLRAWFEACIHFADVVLLTKREGVANKWLSDFTGHFRDLFYPCLFEMVKAGKVRNPQLVLDPQARRMSHFLDEEQDWVVTGSDGEVIEDDDEDEEDGRKVSDEEEVEAAPEEDPYLAKDAAGRRAKRIPEIAKYLPEEK